VLANEGVFFIHGVLLD